MHAMERTLRNEEPERSSEDKLNHAHDGQRAPRATSGSIPCIETDAAGRYHQADCAGWGEGLAVRRVTDAEHRACNVSKVARNRLFDALALTVECDVRCGKGCRR